MRRGFLAIVPLFLAVSLSAQDGLLKVKDALDPLPGGKVKMEGYFEDYILLSQENWAKDVMPYEKVLDFFREGRTKFALGEMPGKSIRTNSLLW